jgi:hypothetical protein
MPSYEMLPLIFMEIEMILFDNSVLKIFLLNTHMGYWPGGEIMASLLPVVTHMQKLSY